MSRRRSGSRQLLTAVCLCGALNASAQFVIVPGSATIAPGASVALSVSNSNSYPLLESADLSGIANHRSYVLDAPGSIIPPSGMVTYAGVPFNSPSGSFDSWNASAVPGADTGAVANVTINIACPKKVSTLYTLINSFWGEWNTAKDLAFIRLDFTNGSNAIIPLNGDVNLRDIRNQWTSGLGASTNNGFAISTSEVWSAAEPAQFGEPITFTYRRDMQTIILPAPYNGYYLKSVTMIDSGANYGSNAQDIQRMYLSGLTVKATAGAPITWHSGSPTGPVISNTGAPSYKITVTPDITTTYYAVAESQACMQQATITVRQSGVGISTVEGNDAGVQLYPNPADNRVNVRLSDALPDNTPVTIEIIDMLGKQLLREACTRYSSTGISLSTEALSAGSYILQVTADNKPICRKQLLISK